MAELIPGSVPCPLSHTRNRRAHTCGRGYVYTRESTTFSPLSLSTRRRDLRVPGPRFKPTNAYSRYECFKSKRDYSSTSRYVSGAKDGEERTASSAGCIKTGYFIIFHIDKRGREEKKSGEHDENNGRRSSGVQWREG